jgi:hypothetical protein
MSPMTIVFFLLSGLSLSLPFGLPTEVEVLL